MFQPLGYKFHVLEFMFQVLEHKFQTSERKIILRVGTFYPWGKDKNPLGRKGIKTWEIKEKLRFPFVFMRLLCCLSCGLGYFRSEIKIKTSFYFAFRSLNCNFVAAFRVY